MLVRRPGRRYHAGIELSRDRNLPLTAGFISLGGWPLCDFIRSRQRVTTTQLDSPYLRDPDVQTMLRVKEGDEGAFAEIVAGYQHRLTAILMHLGSDRQSSEDLAQEVFLRIYRARNGYQPTAKFSTWVFRIAHNLASNNRRSKGRRKEVQLSPSESGARPQEQLLKEKSALMPARQLDRMELQTHVHEAMETLNERQRMALLLHKFEGMSYADIGESMELTPAAVKSLLSRARGEPARKTGGVHGLMAKLIRLTPELRDDFVAYLDGELSDEAAERVELVIAQSEVARSDMEGLARTYETLDTLGRPEASDDFAERTMATIRVDDLRADPRDMPWYRASEKPPDDGRVGGGTPGDRHRRFSRHSPLGGDGVGSVGAGVACDRTTGPVLGGGRYRFPQASGCS